MADGVEDDLGALLDVMAPVFALELAGATAGGATARAVHRRGVEFEVIGSGTFDRIELVTHNSDLAIHVLSFTPTTAVSGDTINLNGAGNIAATLYALIERGAFRNDQVRREDPASRGAEVPVLARGAGGDAAGAHPGAHQPGLGGI